MKKEDTPQDKSALENISHEVCYVKNEDGSYESVLSTGWDVKTDALENAWDEIHERIENARIAVQQRRKSPLYYHMEKNLMDLTLLSSYVKFSKLRVWWHLHPSVYEKLSPKILQRYAKVFNIAQDELNTLT